MDQKAVYQGIHISRNPQKSRLYSYLRLVFRQIMFPLPVTILGVGRTLTR